MLGAENKDMTQGQREGHPSSCGSCTSATRSGPIYSREQDGEAASATSTLLGDRMLLSVPREEERGSRWLGWGRPWLEAMESTAVSAAGAAM